jgi:WD40 repeat protein
MRIVLCAALALFCCRAAAQQPLTLSGHAQPLKVVAFSPDGERITSISQDKTLKEWEAATGRELRSLVLKGHTELVTALELSPDQKRVAVGYWLGGLEVYNADSGQRLYLSGVGARWVDDLAFSADGKQLATFNMAGTAQLRDAETGAVTRSVRPEPLYEIPQAVAFSPDGSRLAHGGRSGKITILRLAAERAPLSLAGHPAEPPTRSGGVQCLVFSPDSKRLVSGGVDRIVRVWNSESGQELLALKGHTSEIYAVAVSPDGARIASGGIDQSIRIWDMHTGKELRVLPGHAGIVTCLAFSPDGKRLVSGGWDKAVMIWNELSAQNGDEK